MRIYRDDREARRLIAALLDARPSWFLPASLLRAADKYLSYEPLLTVRIDGAEFDAQQILIEPPPEAGGSWTITVTAQQLPSVYGACELRHSSWAGVEGGRGHVHKLTHQVRPGSYESRLVWVGSWEKISNGKREAPEHD